MVDILVQNETVINNSRIYFMQLLDLQSFTGSDRINYFKRTSSRTTFKRNNTSHRTTSTITLLNAQQNIFLCRDHSADTFYNDE